MKKTTIKLFQVLLIIFFSVHLYAQRETNQTSTEGLTEANKAFVEEYGVIKCATVEYNDMLRQQFPEIPVKNEFESWMSNRIQELKASRVANPGNTTEIYTIPVVVHILHNGEAVGTAPNIVDAQVESQITVMNEDYRRMVGTPGGANSTGAAVDIEIEFCLASVDPNGNATNGIDRVNIGQDGITAATSGAALSAMNAIKPNSQWDPTKYLNMWTVKFQGGASGLLGYAQFPDNSGLNGLNASGGAANTDGVVAGYQYFGSSDHDNGSFITSSPYDKGRTMTHEVGHWLGLRHIWGDGNCSADDFCDDTPRASTDHGNCGVYNTCDDTAYGAATDPNDMVQNYMDYTNDTCMDTFTQDQKDRMVIVMQNSPRRVELNTSNVCSGFSMSLNEDPTGVCAPGSGVITFNYMPTGGYAEVVDFSATGNPGGTSVTFNPASASDTEIAVAMTITGITAAMAGDYTITIEGQGTTITNSIDATLKVLTTGAGSTSLQTPTNGQTDVALAPTFTWATATNALSYEIQVATDNTFTSIVEDETSTTNSHTTVNTLSPSTTYYWRVRALSSCGDGSYSTTFSFVTGTPDYCTSTYTQSNSEYIVNVAFNTIDNGSGDAATDGYEDFTNISTDIEAGETHTVTVTINTVGNYLDHCFVFIDWNIDYIFDTATERYDLGNIANVTAGDLSLDIVVPDTAQDGTTRMRVILEYEDANDGVGDGPCDTDHLSEYGETEDYTLNVTNTVGIADLAFNSFSIYPNPSNGVFNLNLQSNNHDKVNIYLYDMQGRLINEKIIRVEDTRINTTLDYSSLSTGIYLLKVAKGDQLGVQQVIIE